MEALTIKEIKGYIPGLHIQLKDTSKEQIIYLATGYKTALLYKPGKGELLSDYVGGLTIHVDSGWNYPIDEIMPILYPIDILIDPNYAEQDYTLIHEMVSIIYKRNVEINNYELAKADNNVSIEFEHQSGSKFKLHFFIDGSFSLEDEIHRECYLGDVQPIYDFLYAHHIDTRNLIGQGKAINVLSYVDNPYIS